MKLILAENYCEAEQTAYEYYLERGQWLYVSSEHVVQGTVFADDKFIFAPGCTLHPRHAEIMRVVDLLQRSETSKL